jgi:hypothetical protein
VHSLSRLCTSIHSSALTQCIHPLVCITSTSILASLHCTCFVIARQIFLFVVDIQGKPHHRPRRTLRPTDRNIVVARDNNLKREVIHYFHDTPSAGHPGITNSYELAKQDTWWPNMKQDVEQYVKGCTICQANKVNNRPLKPAIFPITLEHSLPFQTIAMDFITKLPKSGKYDMILTIMDHDCTKAAIFIPFQETITAEGVATLYLRHVYPQFGIPKKIISDRDTRFTSKFAKGLNEALGIQSNMSTAYHPQTDGQSERTNQGLEIFIQCYCNEEQDNWHIWLPMAEFTHNQWPNATTKKTPFDLIMGYVKNLQVLKFLDVSRECW